MEMKCVVWVGNLKHGRERRGRGRDGEKAGEWEGIVDGEDERCGGGGRKRRRGRKEKEESREEKVRERKRDRRMERIR